MVDEFNATKLSEFTLNICVTLNARRFERVCVCVCINGKLVSNKTGPVVTSIFKKIALCFSSILTYSFSFFRSLPIPFVLVKFNFFCCCLVYLYINFQSKPYQVYISAERHTWELPLSLCLFISFSFSVYLHSLHVHVGFYSFRCQFVFTKWQYPQQHI